MPRGWYLAQGLIPLGYSSSDDEEGPCELPDGRLVCGPHGFVVCGRCCSDYSFMDEVLNNEEDEDEDDEDDAPSVPGGNATDSDRDDFNRLRRGTGRVFPTKFVLPLGSASATPSVLFSGHKSHMTVTRQVNSQSI